MAISVMGYPLDPCGLGTECAGTYYKQINLPISQLITIQVI